MNKPPILPLAIALTSILALGTSVTAEAVEPGGLSLDDRVRCHEALERVRWQYRSEGVGPTFEQTVPEGLFGQRAEDVLLRTAALERFWGVTITPERLQAELNRMAARSKSPERLRQLFAALGDDPTAAAECLARPILTDRLLRSYYANDDRLHGELKALAQRELKSMAAASNSKPSLGVRTELEWWRRSDRPDNPSLRKLKPNDFDARMRELRSVAAQPNGDITLDRPSPLREDDSRFFALIVRDLDEGHVGLEAIEWAKYPFDQWWGETREDLEPNPADRAFDFHLPAIGQACADDTWSPTFQLLDPRYWHTAVWTGSEMIVWGGMEAVGNIFGDGSRYDPATDTWTRLPAAGAPSPRQTHTAVWTGTEMSSGERPPTAAAAATTRSPTPGPRHQQSTLRKRGGTPARSGRGRR